MNRQLTTADLMALRQTMQRTRQQLVNRPYRQEDNQAYLTPEVYVAKVDSDGIPALTPATGGSATNWSSSDDNSSQDQPGVAACYIYVIFDDVSQPAGPGNPMLNPIKDFQIQNVYNLNLTKVSQGWYAVSRTKDGRWIIIDSLPGPTSGLFVLEADLTAGGSAVAHAASQTSFKRTLYDLSIPSGFKIASGQQVWGEKDQFDTVDAGDTGHYDKDGKWYSFPLTCTQIT